METRVWVTFEEIKPKYVVHYLRGVLSSAPFVVVRRVGGTPYTLEGTCRRDDYRGTAFITHSLYRKGHTVRFKVPEVEMTHCLRTVEDDMSCHKL